MALITLGINTLPVGSILQVKSTFYNTPFTQNLTANTKTAINNLSVNITPSSTSSKIFLFGRTINELAVTDNHDMVYFFLRGSTPINLGVASGNRTTGMITSFQNFRDADSFSTPDPLNMFTIDSSHNSTSQLTYHIGVSHTQSQQISVNRTHGDSDSTSHERTSSEIIAMEIKG